MQTFVIQIVVEAEDVETALSKKTEGKVISVNPKTQQATTSTPFSRTVGPQLPKPQ